MRRSWAGILGIVVALFGLTATIAAEHVIPKPPEPERPIKAKVSVGRFNLNWTSKDEAPPPPPPEEFFSKRRVRLAGTILGIVAFPFAVLSWARRERAWWGFAVCGFAASAIAWQTIVLVFAIGLFLMVFSHA